MQIYCSMLGAFIQYEIFMKALVAVVCYKKCLENTGVAMVGKVSDPRFGVMGGHKESAVTPFISCEFYQSQNL